MTTTAIVDIPTRWKLSANGRLHWAVKGQRTGWIRTLAYVRTRTDAAGATYERVHILATIAYPPPRRRRDVTNAMPMVKACVDGLVDAGLLPDDDDTRVVGPDLRPDPEPAPPGYYRVTLTITHLEVAPC